MRKWFAVLLVICSPLIANAQDDVHEVAPDNPEQLTNQLFQLTDRITYAGQQLLPELDAWTVELEQREQNGASGSWELERDWRCNQVIAAIAQAASMWSAGGNIYADAVSSYCAAAEIPPIVKAWWNEMDAASRERRFVWYWLGYYTYLPTMWDSNGTAYGHVWVFFPGRGWLFMMWWNNFFMW